MGCDIVVALGKATLNQQTLFGQNSDCPPAGCLSLRRTQGRAFAPGEKVRAQFLELPQARQSLTVLGCQPHGYWGYHLGVNELGVAIGRVGLRNQLRCPGPTLLGPDLVRLALERSASAHQAVDLLSALVSQYGQGAFPGCPLPDEADSAFLIADAHEAYLLETSGSYWAQQEIYEVRAVSNVGTVRQDWDRISPGLAANVIERGWWPGDGTKVDFAGTLGETPVGQASALRRWGRATYLVEQQNGHIDAAFFRRVLADHYEGTTYEVAPRNPADGPTPLCQHPTDAPGSGTAISMVAQLGPPSDHLSPVWIAFGPPCISVYFPLFLEGELPEPLTLGGTWPGGDNLAGRIRHWNEELRQEPQLWALAHDRFGRLQARFDQEAEEFAAEGTILKRSGASANLKRLTTLFMQHLWEQFDSVWSGMTRGPGTRKPSLEATMLQL